MTDFVDLIVQNMQEYNAEVVEKVNEIAEEIGKEALKRIKKSSPRGGGKYAKGWRFEVRRNNDGAIRIRIYNKTDWQLTHLLENFNFHHRVVETRLLYCFIDRNDSFNFHHRVVETVL